ncbi:MAG: alpha/beta hydrolase [Candidatus Vogelbacteria bacterium]|nr:alpha/beta hydrolase [Candidatus Vogelbacteria bacterium]
MTKKKLIRSRDGTEIYYEVYGEHSAGKPVLFFVHGVGGDLDAWQYVKNFLLAKKYSAVAMDIRGHGHSGHPRKPEAYKLERFVEDVIEVFDAEQLDKVILIGHSLGAVLTTHITLAHQKRVEKLILIAGSYLPPSYFKIPGSFALTDFLALISPPPVRAGHSIYPSQKHHKDIEIFGLMRTIARNSVMSYILSSREILKNDLTTELTKIEVPTLIISGSKDSVFPTNISELMHSQIKNSQLKIIKEANHVVVLNNAEETAELIGEFLI